MSFCVARVQIDGLLRRQPLALYRLSPVSGLTCKGQRERVAGYRLERRLSDWVTQQVRAASSSSCSVA